MRLIEWNSQGAFRLKNERILSFKPDILIVPECENEQKLEFGKLTPKPNDFFWYGDSANKGIGVFSYSDYKFELLKSFNPRFRYVIPIKVTGQGETFLLFAIWAMDNKENPDERYIAQVWLAINYYSDLINADTILIGDFNSNQIWDEKERVGNHTDVVNFLNNRKIQSLYHFRNSVNHGQEKDRTFSMYRKKDKPYHIDYCFASQKIYDSNFTLSLGAVDDWIDLSDHVPMIIDFSTKLDYEKMDNSLTQLLINRFKRLDSETQVKFTDLIDKLLLKSKDSDKFDSSIDFLSQRKSIIDNADRLFEIDKLIKEINTGANTGSQLIGV